MNVTDVNDKIYAAAQQQGVDSAELGAAMTQRYFDDTTGSASAAPTWSRS